MFNQLNETETQDAPKTPLSCEYTLLDNGIHLFVHSNVDHNTIEEWIVHVDKIYETVTSETKLPMLIDNRNAGGPPFPHTFNRGREWVKTLKVHPQVRLAIVYSNNFLMSLFETLIRTLRLGHLEVKSFSGEQSMERATQWLTEEWNTKHTS